MISIVMLENLGRMSRVDITTFFQLFIVLVVLLLFLLLMLLFKRKKRKITEQNKQNEREKDIPSLEALVKQIKSKQTSTLLLGDSLNVVIEHYGEIKEATFDLYAEILVRICTHPNTNKELILKFNRALEKRNPKYAKQINSYIVTGLNARNK